MNTLTSLFIEATMHNIEKDKDLLMRDELQRRADYGKLVTELFTVMDQDGSGDISEEEFLKHATDSRMVAFVSRLDLDVTDIAHWYAFLSCRGKYAVEVDTFVGGCMKLKGTARSMDLQFLLASDKRSSHVLEQLTASCNEILSILLGAAPHISRLPSMDRLSVPHERHPCDATVSSCPLKSNASTTLRL